MWSKIATKRFFQEDIGVAKTEYLVVLGLVVGATSIAVLAFGDNLSVIWQNWATWFRDGPISP